MYVLVGFLCQVDADTSLLGYKRPRHLEAEGDKRVALNEEGVSVLTIHEAAAINTVSGVNMTTRRQMLKIKASYMCFPRA